MPHDNRSHRVILQEIAHRVMLKRGFLPEISQAARMQLDHIQQPAGVDDPSLRDLRHLLWASIDNDDSMDLDQLTVAEDFPDGRTRILVAIAVRNAGHETTSFFKRLKSPGGTTLDNQVCIPGKEEGKYRSPFSSNKPSLQRIYNH